MLIHNIQCLAKGKGISLAYLEREAGYKSKALYHLTPDSSAMKLCKIAKMLGTTVEELLEGEDVKGN